MFMNEQEKKDQKEKKDAELVNSMQDFKNILTETIKTKIESTQVQ